MNPFDFLGVVRDTLRQALAWLEDPDSSVQLRYLARDLVHPLLIHLPDERAVTDVLAMLHRAIDRGDMLVMPLVYEIPRDLVDGREASAPALLPLGNHAMAAGAIEPLIVIAHAAMLARWMVVPASWIRIILEAEVDPDPRDLVVGIVDDWLRREETLAADVAEVLRRRPAINEKLLCPSESPF